MSTLSHSQERPTSAQHEIANLLLRIAPPNIFEKHDRKKKYISLDVQVGKSRNNKNAVSVLRSGVSFMVPDWTLAARAEALGLATLQRDKKPIGKRLFFSKLKPDVIRSACGLFFGRSENSIPRVADATGL